MADASDLKSDDENREGSIPSSRTFKYMSDNIILKSGYSWMIFVRKLK